LKKEREEQVTRADVITRDTNRLDTNLLHDAGLPLGERGVPSELIVDVLHFNFHPALGLLAVGRG